MTRQQEAKQSEHQDLIEAGLAWTDKCREKYGFVYTLGLLEFLSTNLKGEMSDDIIKSLSAWEKLQ